MCPSGRVGIESNYLTPRPELFAIRSHCFDAVKIASTCFKKKQGSTCTDCNPSPGQLFVNACHLGRGGAQRVQNETQMDQHYFQNQYLEEDFKCKSY